MILTLDYWGLSSAEQKAPPRTLYLNDGSGAMTASPTSTGLDSLHPSEIAVADFDGDGHLDVWGGIAGERSFCSLPPPIYFMPCEASIAFHRRLLHAIALALSDL